ncbi:hypothetical protein C8P68_11228 [Mucilaginibacter yixingensis]|uniref:PD-(D/E)XK nuclease superfamily protein n=1 Tax=Mucilaginibacter yixingensis TaxID=1295612 RepID=A0A2T5J4J4_9SPHI|nr:hypothetical protein [Mucilaginibacter yixingensis]PTQ92428.1 hypothetical protein C8P68_11228 [Mucilaginibacter yixingensis]
MPFKHFLNTSLKFERTHQLILQCLFNDALFLKAATGLEVENPQVVLEPVKSLFDIGILDPDGNMICLIELKMWSNLSNAQLERQRRYLELTQCPGVHILLGASDLQFYRDESYDDIAEFSDQRSCKVGYKELISILERFASLSPAGAPITIIAEDYKEALQKQEKYINDAWLDSSASLHLRSYSAYSKIRKYLINEAFYIYSVNNPGGTAHILNDDRSWTEFLYQGHKFKMYQEILDLKLMIRIESFGAPNAVKTSLKQRVIQLLQQKDPNQISWSFSSRTSKYHKIAIYHPVMKTEVDCEQVATIMRSLNAIIKDIVRIVEDNKTELEVAE